MKLTTINDYVDVIQEKYPNVTISDIKRILNYCWKMIYLYNQQGNDVLIKNPDLVFFIGKLTKNSLKNYQVYKYKLARRIRFMFKRTKSKWDGYYYFARTRTQFAKYLEQAKTRKYITFENVKMYRLLEECKVRESDKLYIFRIGGYDSNKFTKFYYNLKTKDAELIIQRDELNMDDLMVSNNNYKYIK